MSERAIVKAEPGVSVALSAIPMEYRGRVMTKTVFLVLWEVRRRWDVIYVEAPPPRSPASC